MTQLDLLSVPMAPAAVQSRRTGRRRALTGLSETMRAYRDALVAHGPLTDQDAAARLGWQVSSVNARRNDWQAIEPGRVQADGRQRKVWADGSTTTRTRWRWVP